MNMVARSDKPFPTHFLWSCSNVFLNEHGRAQRGKNILTVQQCNLQNITIRPLTLWLLWYNNMCVVEASTHVKTATVLCHCNLKQNNISTERNSSQSRLGKKIDFVARFPRHLGFASRIPQNTWRIRKKKIIGKRRAAKLYRTWFSPALKTTFERKDFKKVIWKLSPRTTQYTPLHSLNQIWKPWNGLLGSVAQLSNLILFVKKLPTLAKKKQLNAI